MPPLKIDPTVRIGFSYPTVRQRCIFRTPMVAGQLAQFDSSLLEAESENLRVADPASGLVTARFVEGRAARSGRVIGVVADTRVSDNQKGYLITKGVVNIYIGGTVSAGDGLSIGGPVAGNRYIAIALESGVAGDSISVLFDGEQGFGVYMETDGANSPPVVTITSPADGAVFSVGASITFTATCTDADEVYPGDEIDWTDNGDVLATDDDSFADSTLSPGVHEITASWTDSGGLTGYDSVRIAVLDSSGEHDPPDIPPPIGDGGYHGGQVVLA